MPLQVDAAVANVVAVNVCVNAASGQQKQRRFFGSRGRAPLTAPVPRSFHRGALLIAADGKSCVAPAVRVRTSWFAPACRVRPSAVLVSPCDVLVHRLLALCALLPGCDTQAPHRLTVSFPF